MQAPRKRDSKILNELNANKDPLESRRTRTSMLLAAKIIEGRKAKGWNNVEFAEKMGKLPSVITRWLSGTHNFTSDTLSDIQEALGIELLSLNERKEIEPAPKMVLTVVVKAENSLGNFNNRKDLRLNELRAHSRIAESGGILASEVSVSYKESY
jgi:ribosome-binding protein aMBF1 (putative translation factor)